MKLKPLAKCRVCSSESLVDILTLGDHHLSDFTSTNKKPHKFPLSIILCNECNLLQLKHTAPQKFLYTENYGYRSGINNTMQRELREIVQEALKKVKKGKDLTVLDIGANDGTLLSNYPKEVYKIGVEPVKKLAKACKKHADLVINDFFQYSSYKKKAQSRKADIITVISCFYDMEEPNKFIEDVKKVLNEDGVLVIQQNYLVTMLEQNAYDNIVHEHLEYYSLLSMDNLLNRHGLEIFEVKQNLLNGGSFRTYIAYKGKKKVTASVKDLREYEQKLGLNKIKVYKNFAKRVEKSRKQLLALIRKLRNRGKTVYVYGASTRGNTILQYSGLGKTLINAAVERNSDKWGMKIASVGIPIISEADARLIKPDYMLVLPWFFKEEFLEREKDYLTKGGKFIFPLPEITVI